MQKKSSKIFAFVALGSLLAGTYVSLGGGYSTSILSSTRATKGHVGYHYDRVESTCNKQGHIEYWTCCECGEYFTEEPDGSFQDRGSADAFSGGFRDEVLLPLGAHSYKYDKQEIIGYKHGECSVCKKTVDVLMTSDDISISDTSCYGGNPGFNTSGGDEGNRGKTGGVGWQQKVKGDPNVSILFPRVDYRAYTNVVFEFGTSTQWYGIGLTINSEKDLLDIPSSHLNAYGAIEAICNSNNELVLTSRTSTGLVKSVVVTDENVINGTSSLSGTLVLPEWRCFYLNKIDLNHESHKLSEEIEILVPKDKIGHKIGTCEICLAKVDADVMTDTDISLSKGSCYGANPGSNTSSGSEGNRGILGGILWEQKTESDPNVSILFPRVDYRAYTNVVFEFGTSTRYSGIGLTINSEKDLLDIPSSHMYAYGAIEAICNSNNELVLTSRTSTGLVKSVVVTDENVINGTSSLSGTLVLPSWRCFYLNKIIVNHSEHKAGDLTISYVRIGHKLLLCSDCCEALPTTEVMEDKDIDLNNGYGVHVENLSGYDAYNGARILLANSSWEVGTVYLPRVEFEAYTKVTFTFYYNCLWGRFGFSDSINLGGYGDGSVTAYINLEITYDNGSYKAVLSCPGKSQSVSTFITDTNVLNGDEALQMYLSTNGYTSFSLKSVSVVK